MRRLDYTINAYALRDGCRPIQLYCSGLPLYQSIVRPIRIWRLVRSFVSRRKVMKNETLIIEKVKLQGRSYEVMTDRYEIKWKGTLVTKQYIHLYKSALAYM